MIGLKIYLYCVAENVVWRRDVPLMVVNLVLGQFSGSIRALFIRLRLIFEHSQILQFYSARACHRPEPMKISHD